jgi:hypothetical protein
MEIAPDVGPNVFLLISFNTVSKKTMDINGKKKPNYIVQNFLSIYFLGEIL